MDCLSSDELIYYKEGGQVKSLGYEIESGWLQNDSPVSTGSRVDLQTRGGGSMPLLAIPAGLFRFRNMMGSGRPKSCLDAEVVPECLLTRLFGLTRRKRSTRRRTSKAKRRRTRKRRIKVGR